MRRWEGNELDDEVARQAIGRDAIGLVMNV